MKKKKINNSLHERHTNTNVSRSAFGIFQQMTRNFLLWINTRKKLPRKNINNDNYVQGSTLGDLLSFVSFRNPHGNSF